jgi:organic hydroperoxide reductase OsmC/OhrA
MAFSLDIEVERYIDRAYGVLTGLESGDCWISELILHPTITLKAGYEMTAATMTHLHEHAPEHCYIARSIKTKGTVRSA